jgi:hypothetical protein
MEGVVNNKDLIYLRRNIYECNQNLKCLCSIGYNWQMAGQIILLHAVTILFIPMNKLHMRMASYNREQ